MGFGMSPPWQVARCASDDVGCGPVTIRGSHGGWHEPSETGTGVALLAARPIAVSDPPRHVAGDSVHVVGVSAYLTKDRAPEELLAAIRSVLQRKRYLSETVALELADHVALAGSGSEPPHELLSPREYEVLVLLASARSVSEIAARLDLSVKTVSTPSSRESACGRRWRACRDLRALRLAARRAPQGTAGYHAPGVLRTGHGHGGRRDRVPSARPPRTRRRALVDQPGGISGEARRSGGRHEHETSGIGRRRGRLPLGGGPPGRRCRDSSRTLARGTSDRRAWRSGRVVACIDDGRLTD